MVSTVRVNGVNNNAEINSERVMSLKEKIVNYLKEVAEFNTPGLVVMNGGHYVPNVK